LNRKEQFIYDLKLEILNEGGLNSTIKSTNNQTPLQQQSPPPQQQQQQQQQ